MRKHGMRNLGGIFLLSIFLAACGGDAQLGSGGDGVDPPGGGNDGDSVVADLVILLTQEELPSNAVDPEKGVTITAQVRDAGNRLVEGAQVSFEATSGALQIDSNTTDSQGRASAVLTTGGDETLREITVLAESASVQQTVVIPVVTPDMPSPPNFRLGSDTGDSFQSGTIAIGQFPLAAGGSSGLSLKLLDVANDNQPFPGDALVQFTSPCIGEGLASVEPNPAPVNSGSISASYRARGCAGEDLITATVDINGSQRQATGTIEVEAAELGSISFVEAEPDFIGLQGSGRPTTSVLTFRVEDVSGGPVVQQEVEFSLNTAVGGISLTPITGTTDNNGEVQTTVSAGTVATSIRVTAAVNRNDETISSQSDQLIVSTGIPDNDSFSVSVGCHNIEGWGRDGVTTDVTVRAADRFNNPVPDGTAISFTTEGGSIESGCQTSNGNCTVPWTSQDPRPEAFNGCDSVNGAAGPDSICSVIGSEGASRAGRASLLVTAIGEESFTDLNGNGRFDAGEQFEDLPEAFRDDDEDGTRDLGPQFRNGGEEFLDFNSNGIYDGSDGLFTGVLCNDPSACSPSDMRTLNVRRVVPVIMSGSNPVLDLIDDIEVAGGGMFDPSSGSFEIGQAESMIIRFVIRDLNDQPMPADTNINFSVAGDAGELVGTTGFTVPCMTDDTAGGNTYGFAFSATEIEDDPDSNDANGIFELSVESPSGLVSIYSFSVTTLAPP